MGGEEERVVGGDGGSIDEFEDCEGAAIDQYAGAVGEADGEGGFGHIWGVNVNVYGSIGWDEG